MFTCELVNISRIINYACTDINSKIFVVLSLSLVEVFHNRNLLAVTTHNKYLNKKFVLFINVFLHGITETNEETVSIKK